MFGTNYTENGFINYRSAEEINSAMGRVYGHMSLAVIVSMLVSYFVGTSPELLAFFFTGILKWIVIFAPLAAIFGISMVLGNNPTKGVAQLCLHGFAALMGLSFATIFAVFTMGSIVSAFMGAAILFGVMSGYGYFTKKWYKDGSKNVTKNIGLILRKILLKVRDAYKCFVTNKKVLHMMDYFLSLRIILVLKIA
jgi:FtsH-binding integral membrane protein